MYSRKSQKADIFGSWDNYLANKSYLKENRVISKKTKLSDQNLNRIDDWLNDTHDIGSIHSSYWERVESVKLYMMSKYKKGKQACLAN